MLKIEDIELELTNLNYTVKRKTRNRVAVITDQRQFAIDNILDAMKDCKPSVLRDPASLKLSTMGVIQIGEFKVVTKPASKNVLRAEQEATQVLKRSIDHAVEQESGPIDITMGEYTLKNCVTASCDQVKGNPKADIVIIDKNQTEVGFISHKKQGGALAFQQYGGISKDAGELIHSDPIVESFVADLQQASNSLFNQNTVPAGFSAFRYIPNTESGKTLVSRSVYGPDWKPFDHHNRQAVHCIGQGVPQLSRNPDSSYRLTFSESMHYSHDVDWAFDGQYQAVLAATYRLNRKVQNQNITLINVRAGIYPYDFVKNRNAMEI